MNDQLPLLKACKADVYIFLDACRADYADLVIEPDEGFEITLADKPHPIVFSANPVFDRQLERSPFEPKFHTLRLWEKQWAYLTDLHIPSVHPMAVTASFIGVHAVLGYAESTPILWFLQPHCPYIGDTFPLALAAWKEGRSELGQAIRQVARESTFPGGLHWDVLRQAYEDNVRVAWNAIKTLIRAVPGRYLITADHGELLGENGEYGHVYSPFAWECRELVEVPWIEITSSGLSDEHLVEDRLRQLGYVE